MDAGISIRPAASRDYPAIRAVTRHAFGRADEADLIERLRADGDVLFELVAASGVALQGHVLFSKLAIERGGETMHAAALAPLAVLPAFQRQGLGRALVEASLARAAEMSLPAIVVLGDPLYYSRFGFSSESAESLNASFSGPAFMALELELGCLRGGGRVRYAGAFGV